MTYYSEREQRERFREAAWDLGCICPSWLAPHTHRHDCPLYETEQEHAERLEDEHRQDQG